VEGRAQGGIPPLRENDGGRERDAVPCRLPRHLQTAARNQAGMATDMVRRQHGRPQEHRPAFQGERGARANRGTVQETEGRRHCLASVHILGQDEIHFQTESEKTLRNPVRPSRAELAVLRQEFRGDG